ncbi:hypothetical protein WJX74_000099 [Apatococcus lobatus]|uniref:Signal recognition particle 19 kDa protein n=1 Tax=Apatococcus lobatus TaxID=904363 RepID=A0AAW1QM76_9CHLO
MAEERQHDKRVCIYPSYLDSKKSVSEGRRVAAAIAVERPIAPEIHDCCEHLKLASGIENKAYSRDYWVRGRVRVQLLKDDGTPANPEIPNRRVLLRRIAELLPKHPNRSERAQALRAAQQKAAAKQAAAAAPTASTKPSKKDKKAKKGR